MSSHKLPIQLALGLFVVGQFLFLFAANFSGLIRRFAPDVGERPTTEVIAAVTSHWAQLTNQPQDWSLFAPEPTRTCSFLEWMSVGWANGDISQMVYFDNVVQMKMDPNDRVFPEPFLRLGQFRLRCYESNLAVALPLPLGKSAEEMEDAWRESIFDGVRRHGPAIRAYLRWRLARNPPGPIHGDPSLDEPDRLTLWVQPYDILPPPGRPERWQARRIVPVARWLIFEEDPGSLPVEAYNPIFKKFERLPRSPER